MDILKVSTKSNPNSVAGAIANFLKDKKRVELQTVGAGALNQATKAIIIARGFLAPLGINIVSIPSFTDIKIENETKTAIKLIIEAL